MENNNTYEAWRVTGAEGLLAFSMEFGTPEKALDDFFENYTPEEMFDKGLTLDRMIVNDNDFPNDAVEYLEEYCLEDLIKDEKFSEYLFEKFGEEHLTDTLTYIIREEGYCLEDLMENEKISDYLLEKFGEERLTDILKEVEEIELD